MFQRFSTKHLLIALAILSLLYLATFAVGSGSDRSFRKNLAEIDTSAVTQMQILRATGEVITLNRMGQNWSVEGKTATPYPANSSGVNSALGILADLQALQLVADDSEKWASYQLTDSAATRVKVSISQSQALDLLVGRFEYKQSGLMSYVRLAGENEVYLVNGFLDASFNKESNDWRNKSLLNGNVEDWLALSFTYPADTSFQMIKGGDNLWRLPDSTLLDASKVTPYLTSLAALKGRDFIEEIPGTKPRMKVEVVTNSGESLSVMAIAGDSAHYVLTSSQNPESFFSGDEGLWGQIFVGKGHFLPMNSEAVKP